jgi:SPP1 gp7 family putative phage head morphogenesis protein
VAVKLPKPRPFAANVALGALVPSLAKTARLVGRPVRTRFPTAIEASYRAVLRRFVAEMAEIFRRVILPGVAELPQGDPTRTDARKKAVKTNPRAKRMVDKGRDEFVGVELRFAKAAETAIADVSKASRKTLRDQIGVDPFETEPKLRGVLAEAAKENVKLIKTIPERYFGAIETQVSEGIELGLRHEEIADRLRANFASNLEGTELAIANNRAAFIARDQVGKVFSKVTESRQRDLGITKYRWQTVEDSRVRGDPDGKYPKAKPSHFARNGKVFSWDDPPEGGHPGEAFLCRCISSPVLDEVDG